MKRLCLQRKAILGLSVFSIATLAGCDLRFADWSRAKFETTTSHQAPLAVGGTLDVATQSGSITITGAEVAECRVEATITAHAPTQEEAQQLADQVEIRLESAEDILKIRANKPDLAHNRSVAVSYAITAPRTINVLCESSYGSLHVANIEGAIKGKTSSGSVKAEEIKGELDLNTSYGSIACKHIDGQTVLLRSSSGSITVTDLKGAAKMETSYGSITCEESSGGNLELKTSSGGIRVSNASFGDCLADTSYGSITGNHLKGNNIKLHSNSGSVEVAEAQADTVDLHTSYGRVKAQQITTGNLLAESGSGGIDIACSESCPADLTANVKTAYGSITFAAPPRFSGAVHLATHYGTVRSALPVTMTGQLDKRNIVGRIGEGKGTLRLETSSGSIELK
jgi:DUF4097 and DUF4098 domain-containing protein YvlB